MYQNYPAQHLPQEKKHSGVGIVSFVISILNGLLLLVLVILSATMVSKGVTENDSEMQILGLVLIGSIGISFVGAVLGFINFFQSTRKKVFGVIGFVVNAIAFAGVLLLMIIGTMGGA